MLTKHLRTDAWFGCEIIGSDDWDLLDFDCLKYA